MVKAGDSTILWPHRMAACMLRGTKTETILLGSMLRAMQFERSKRHSVQSLIIQSWTRESQRMGWETFTRSADSIMQCSNLVGMENTLISLEVRETKPGNCKRRLRLLLMARVEFSLPI